MASGALIVKSRHKLAGIDNDYDYGEWYDLTKPTEEELAAQREARFDFRPLLSVVIPAYKTPERYLKEMLDSILAQDLRQLGGLPGGREARQARALSGVLKRYAERDPRIPLSGSGRELRNCGEYQRSPADGVRRFCDSGGPRRYPSAPRLL